MKNIISKPKSGIQPFHGHVFEPKSRAYIAWQEGLLNSGQLNQREAGKFFPEVSSGLTDPFAPQDVPNATPPRDGEIASASQGDGLILDTPGTHWTKHTVNSGSVLPVTWVYTARHLTRRWNYFITREDWNPNQPLSRDQFEKKPFYQVQLSEQPFWSHGNALNPPNPTIHNVMLPERSGYHVMLAVWEVADTGNAFYQVVDLDFIDNESPTEEAPTPDGLRVTDTTVDSISLAWNKPVTAIEKYRIYRDDKYVTDVYDVEFKDSGLESNTNYTYEVTSIDHNGSESKRSQAVQGRTLMEESTNDIPSSPSNLHTMAVTSNSITLMWNPSFSASGIEGYVIYRDNTEVSRVPLNQLSYEDKNLSPDTEYSYFVVSWNTLGNYSASSNILKVATLTDNQEEEDSSNYRHWALNEFFYTGEKVIHNNVLWLCLQSHTAWVDTWAPGASDSYTLWQRV